MPRFMAHHTQTHTTRKKKTKFINVYGTFAVRQERRTMKKTQYRKTTSSRKNAQKMGKLLMKWGYMQLLSHSYIHIAMPTIVYQSTENTNNPNNCTLAPKIEKHFSSFSRLFTWVFIGKNLQLLVRSCLTAKNELQTRNHIRSCLPFFLSLPLFISLFVRANKMSGIHKIYCGQLMFNRLHRRRRQKRL